MNPLQTQLLMIDAYRLIAEVIPDLEGVIIDGGANVGQATEHLRKCFPKAPIHAFEPVSEAFEQLAQRAATLGVRPHHLALGDTEHEAEIRVNRNLWTCSLLDASPRGHEFHDDWCQTVRTERIRVVRLDDWARREGVDRVSFLKLDLQGFELPALRGAGKLLDTVQAIYCEAQIVPEYTGASTFSQIDTFLNTRGFTLYQITDLCLKGAHSEPSCCDGLWLRQDILDQVRSRPTPRPILDAVDRRAVLMADALRLCKEQDLRCVAIYGAGAHTAACGPSLAAPPVNIVAIIDDQPKRAAMWNIPVVTRDEAHDMALDAVILSSDRAERALLSNADRFIESGVPVISLYENGRVTTHRHEAAPSAV